MTNAERKQLAEKHGTPEEFEAAVWRCCDQLFCTVEEAEVAIRKYRDEWREAGQEESK